QRAVLHEHNVQARGERREMEPDSVSYRAAARRRGRAATRARAAAALIVALPGAEPLPQLLDLGGGPREELLREARAARDEQPIDRVGLVHVEAVRREILEPEISVGVDRGGAEPRRHVARAAPVRAQQIERRVEADRPQRARDTRVVAGA